jgi:predicted site-specific integrase-resolvase
VTLPEPKIFSVKDVCKLLSISESTFYVWAAAGKFGELIKINRRVYVSHKNLLKVTGQLEPDEAEEQA